jgi:hypothetical protein
MVKTEQEGSRTSGVRTGRGGKNLDVGAVAEAEKGVLCTAPRVLAAILRCHTSHRGELANAMVELGDTEDNVVDSESA